MIRFIASRLLAAVPLLLIITFFIFALLELVPGDAATILAGEDATPEQIEATRERLDLNDPLMVRYLDWLWHAVRGDLGTSLYSSETVVNALLERLPVTISLGFLAMVMAVAIGLPLGVLAAVRANSKADRIISSVASTSMAVPPFVVGLALVLILGVRLAWFPATGYETIADGGIFGWLRHLFLPALAITALSAAELIRQTRGAVLDTISTDYIKAVKAKGLTRRTIIGKHVLKNSGIPIVTVMGLQVGRILAGVVTIEFIFALPGFGSIAVSAVNQRDLPLVIGVVVFSALFVLVTNILVDVSYGYFKPAVRSQR
jgi:peptide/nickel transport system permease protein